MAGVRGFFEYKIRPECRDSYLEWAAVWKQMMRAAGLADFVVLESNHRPNQFLETFTVESVDRYQMIEEGLDRQGGYRELRERLDGMLQGGRAAVKIWFFTEV